MLKCVAFSNFASSKRFSQLLFQVKEDGRELKKENLILFLFGSERKEKSIFSSWAYIPYSPTLNVSRYGVRT